MVTLDIHFSSWNGIPFYIVVYGFYVYHFSVCKIFLKLRCRIYLKFCYIIYNSAERRYLVGVNNPWLIPSLYIMYIWLICYWYVVAYLEHDIDFRFADVCVQAYWFLLNLLVLEFECGSYSVFTVCMLDSPDIFFFIL